MSFWGKIFGGAAGLALAGPMGALLGGLAGHAVDKMREEGAADRARARPFRFDAHRQGDRSTFTQTAFSIGVVVLGAKLAKVDGRVTRVEVDAFKEVFKVPPAQSHEVADIFDRAKQHAQGFEPYARQIARMHRRNLRTLEEVLSGLFHIAKADGAVNEAELAFLRQVGVIFGIMGTNFDRLAAGHLAAPAAADPYQVLGVPVTASDEQVKSAYRRLIRDYHPDALAAEGRPPEVIEAANKRLAEINEAYGRLRKLRGLR